LTISAGFFSLVAFRFFQIFWFQGITNSAYQAIFNVVPAERRDQTRTFIDGVPGQIGIVLAGVILIFSERFLPPQGLFIIGGFGAALTTYFAWRARREYRGALVEALRAGHPHVFGDDEEPFGGFQRDAAAISTVIGGISHPDPVVRRVSAEILGNLAVPDAQDALVKALEDEDAQVRAALLRSLARAGAVTAMLEVVSCIHDSDPVVRQEAVMALRSLTPYNRGVESILEPLLQDPDSAVRAATAVTLLGFGSHMEAEATLRKMATADQIETRAAALSAIAIWGIADAYDLAEAGLEDPSPAVRRAAATALVEIDADRCIIPLVAALADEDPTVRDAIAKVLGGIGDRALPETLKALEDPAKEEGALFALDQFPTHKNQAPIRLYAQERIKQATYYHQVKLEMDSWTVNERSHLLRHSLQKKSMDLARQALRAVALLGNRRSISLAIDGLNQSDPAQRANALEILEAIDEAALVRPLLGLWEAGQESASATDERYLDLLRDTDPWIRACAVLVCGTLEDPEIIDTLNQLAQRDPDEMVRAVANSVMKGKEFMETLQTLSLMERILFLHRVPLFEELDPADLKRVASIARENLYPSGEYIVRQGDTGDEMYIIVSGEVRVLVHSAEGSPVEVARRKSGEYVGEMAILSHEPRMASLVADGQVRALCLGQKEFEAILRERPGTSIALIQILCARIREQGVGEKI
jgi:HEAT repeat protein